MRKLEILYQDEHYVAIDKPTGLLVHPTIIDRHDKRSAMKALRNQLGRRVYIIHRLDKSTSGVLLFAMTPAAANNCADLFKRNEVEKKYLAVTRGYTEKQGRIDSPLDEVPDKISDFLAKKPRAAKPALTEYRRLAIAELPVHISRHPTSRYSLLEVRPKTGRMHQIRRHLRRINHPVIGDSKHGDHRHNRYFREELKIERMLLSSTELEFLHPYLKSRIKITAPMDEAFKLLIDKFDWRRAVPENWLNPAMT